MSVTTKARRANQLVKRAKSLDQLAGFVMVIYARASSDPSGHFVSCESQIDEGTEVRDEYGMLDGGSFSDNDQSGSTYATEVRGNYLRVLDELRGGRAQVLWTWDPSRAQRDLQVYVTLRQICIEAGAYWVYNGRVFDMTNPHDQRATALDAIEAEAQSHRISENVQRGLKKRADKKLWHGPVADGLRLEFDPRTGKALGVMIDLERVQIRQEVVRRIKKGDTLTRIANDFNRRGVRKARHGRWDVRQVRNVVEASKNPDAWRDLVTGLAQGVVEVLTSVAERCRRGESPKLVAKDLNQNNVEYPLPRLWTCADIRRMALCASAAGLQVRHGEVIGEGAWDGFIDQGDFTLMVARLGGTTNAGRPRDGERTVYRWSGIAVCGVCKKPMFRKLQSQHKTKKITDRYACRSGHVSRDRVALDAYLTELALERLSGSDLKQWLNVSEDAQEARAAMEELKVLRASLAEWRAGAAAGRVSLASFQEIEPGLLERIVRAERRVDQATIPAALRNLVGPNAREAFLALNDPAKERLVLRLIMRPVIYPTKRRCRIGVDTTTIDPGFRVAPQSTVLAPALPTAV